MPDLSELYLDLVEMELAGLVQRVTRPDGQDGWLLTPLSEAILDEIQFRRMVLGDETDPSCQ